MFAAYLISITFLLAGAVKLFARAVRTRRRSAFVGGVLALLCAALVVFYAFGRTPRPQLNVVNTGPTDVLVKLDGREDRLVPGQELSLRYDAGATITVIDLSGGRAGPQGSATAPVGEERQRFSAKVRAIDGQVSIEFQPPASR